MIESQTHAHTEGLLHDKVKAHVLRDDTMDTNMDTIDLPHHVCPAALTSFEAVTFNDGLDATTVLSLMH